MEKIYFVFGVNGVGKTTLMQRLKQRLSDEYFCVYDFDERGVPNNADKSWRQAETLHWVNTAIVNAKNGKSTIVCGFLKIPEIQAALEGSKLESRLCLLDADEAAIAQRIRGRYLTDESLRDLERTTGKTVEKFVSDNVWVSNKLRNAAQEARAHIIETSSKAPEKVADEVLEWVCQS